MSKKPKSKSTILSVTLPDSGKTVQYRPMSITLVMERLKKKYPRPFPPMQEVDYGGGKKVMEMNYAHPLYPQQVNIWQDTLSQITMELAISRGTVVIWDEEKQADLDEFDEVYGVDESDDRTSKERWLEDVAIITDNDMSVLMKAITGVDPTEEGVQTAADGF